MGKRLRSGAEVPQQAAQLILTSTWFIHSIHRGRLLCLVNSGEPRHWFVARQAFTGFRALSRFECWVNEMVKEIETRL